MILACPTYACQSELFTNSLRPNSLDEVQNEPRNNVKFVSFTKITSSLGLQARMRRCTIRRSLSQSEVEREARGILRATRPNRVAQAVQHAVFLYTSGTRLFRTGHFFECAYFRAVTYHFYTEIPLICRHSARDLVTSHEVYLGF